MKRLLQVCAVLAVVLVYGAFASPWVLGEKKTHPLMDFFNRQTNAFLNGQVELLREPPPMLLRLQDPYDPEQNAPIIRNENNGLWDLSLYQGKLYMYFGVGPVVSLFLPYRILSGGEALPPWAAIFIFAVVAFLAGLLVLEEIGRMVFPDGHVPISWTVGGTLLLGLGSGIQFLFVLGAHYEIAVGGGSCFLLVALWLCLRGIRTNTRWLLCAAGLSLGLAISCRPHLVLVAPLIGLLFVRSVPSPFRALAWVCGPLAVICVGLASYNYARFDSPLQFGTKYQLGIYNAPHFKMLRPEFVPRSGYLIFFQKPRFRWGTSAPVRLRAHVPRHIERVEDHFQEGTAGVLWLTPLMLPALALISIRPLRRRISSTRSRLFLASLDTFWIGAGGLLIFLCFFSATIPRYLVDALPLLSLAMWGTIAPLFASERYRTVVVTLSLLAAAYSALAWSSITYAKDHLL